MRTKLNPGSKGSPQIYKVELSDQCRKLMFNKVISIRDNFGTRNFPSIEMLTDLCKFDIASFRYACACSRPQSNRSDTFSCNLPGLICQGCLLLKVDCLGLVVVRLVRSS